MERVSSCPPQGGKASHLTGWSFSAFVPSPQFSVSDMETHLVQYTIKINFLYDNTSLALQIPREGLLSLLYLHC